MVALFTVRDIMTVTDGRLVQGEPSTQVYRFAYDSRQVRAGDCFVAMPGERVDGHDYAAQAAQQGAVCILAGREVTAPEAAVVLVDDPLLALGALGRHQRERYPIPLVGITGSVGKTTTKELIAAVLARRFTVFRSPGNLNSEVGLPIALMELNQTHQVGVLELGMRGLGEIGYLTSIARPTIGVVTNVGPTHMELLGTIENIARAKAELVRGLAPGAPVVLNRDDPRVAAMAAEAQGPVWFFGFEVNRAGDRWVSVCDIAREGEFGQRFRLVTSAGEAEAYVPAPGRHILQNGMAAVAVGLELGMSLAEAAEGLAGYEPSGSRMRILSSGSLRILDDTYNAAPASMIAALDVMRDLAGTGRCIAVLGSMFELGPAAGEGHRTVGKAAAQKADLIMTVGDLAQLIAAEAGDRAQHFPHKAALSAELQRVVRTGDTVLVKGSRGMQMEEVLEALLACHS